MSKIPLQYQVTEYDCGSAAIINAISYIFDFSAIPAAFLKIIYNVCLDKTKNSKIQTSQEAMKYLALWFNIYAEQTRFPIHCSIYEGKDVSLLKYSEIVEKIKSPNTAAVLLCKLYDEHYVTLTDADDEYIYLFDPYYKSIDYQDNKIIKLNNKFKANRKLPINFMETTDGEFYNLKSIPNRLAVVFERTV